MRVLDRLERRRQLLAERQSERPATAPDEVEPQRPSGGSSAADLSGLGEIAVIFPPAAIVLVLALPFLAVAALLRRNR